MANFFTIEEAYAAARSRAGYNVSSVDLLYEGAVTASITKRFDVFLSHSSKDADLIFGVKSLLEREGLSVYVDWIVDPKLDRSQVTAATAEHLRRRMRQCDSLVYAATTNASQSKWMPWELGYFDGYRGDQHVAVMRFVVRQEDTFVGQEYLGLYASIMKSRFTNGEINAIVTTLDQRWMRLSSFGGVNKVWNAY
jgi:hypothetical protein